MEGKHFSGTQNASPISTKEILLLPKGNNFLIHVPFSCSCVYTFSTDLFVSLYVLIFYIKGIILKMTFHNFDF